MRYATAPDGGRLAYRVAGDGPLDVLVIGSHGAVFSVDAAYELPRLRHFEESLAGFCRLITYDLRGFGMSDPLDPEWPVQQRVTDAIAVLDACASHHAALFGAGWGGGMAIEVAASCPERVHSLVIVNGWIRTLAAADFPLGLSPDEWSARDVEGWDPNAEESDIDTLAPSLAGDVTTRQWWIRESRRSASPASAKAGWRWSESLDVREEFTQLRIPVLVVGSTGNKLIPDNSDTVHWMTVHGRDVREILLPCADHIAWAMPHAPLIAAVEEFLVGTSVQRSGPGVVLAVLFTDIVDSTRHNASDGDDAWVDLLTAHDLAVQRAVERSGGSTIKSMGDGVLATFATPSAAITSAGDVIEAAAAIGLEVRSAVHVAEVRQHDNDVLGLGVTIAARALGHARGGQIVVTSTVVELLEGSDHVFEPLGRFALKGIDREWQLYVSNQSIPV